MFSIKKIALNLESDDKWLDRISRNIDFEYDDSNSYKQIIGKIFSVKNTNSRPQSTNNYLTITITFDKRGIDGSYNIEISGCLNSWYLNDSSKEFTREIFNDSINLLSQRLFIRKNKLFGARVFSLSLGVSLFLKKSEQDFKNWMFEDHSRVTKSKGKRSLQFVSKNKALFIEAKAMNQQAYFPINFNLEIEDTSNFTFQNYSVQYVRDINPKWNILLDYLALEIHPNFNHKSERFLKKFRTKLSEQINSLKTTLTYEEENLNYMTNLPSAPFIEACMAEKSYFEVYNCRGQFEKALQKVKTKKAIDRLIERIEKMNEIIDELENRSEIQEENDFLEWEYLQRAMHG